MFGGFPNHGIGGPSLLGSMFSDPFFRDPFGQMEQVMQAHTRFVDPRSAQMQRDPNSMPAHRSRSQPVIEEVHDDDDEEIHKRTGSHAAVVEEPDEDGVSVDRAHKRKEPEAGSGPVHVDRRHAAPRYNDGGARQIAVQGGRPASLLDAFFGGPLMQAPMGQGGASSSFSFSSTTFSSSGPGGVTYQSSRTERVGPGGVREVQSTVRDGRTGQHAMTITRGLGHKEKTVTRTRDAMGSMQGNEVLRGIQHEEADRFDSKWMDHAERSLLNPSGGVLSTARGPSRTPQHQQPRGPLQLPAPPPQPTYSQQAYAHAPNAGHGSTRPVYQESQGYAAGAPQLTRRPSAGYPAPHAPGPAYNAQQPSGRFYGATDNPLPTNLPGQGATGYRNGGYEGGYSSGGSGRYV